MQAAKHAYNAYVKTVGGTTFDGRPLPTFEELGDRQKAGWQQAASQCGTEFSIGQKVQAHTGITGKVSSIGFNKTGLHSVWIDGVDSIGRPFEQHYYSNEVSAV